MAEQSRVATERGIREMAEALASKLPQVSEESEVSESSDTASLGSYHNGRRNSRKRSRKERNSGDHESRNHYLKLEIANSMIVAQETNDKLVEVQTRLDPYVKANNEFALVESAIQRSFKGTDILNAEQFQMKMKLFEEEVNEHLLLCSLAISKIDLHQVRRGLERVYASEHRRAIRRMKHLQLVLYTKHAWKFGSFAIAIYGVFCILMTLFRLVF
jgi:hypothetical protein